jgi:hypothetical protein
LEPARSFASELDFQEQLDRWFDERASASTARSAAARLTGSPRR